MSEIDVIPDQPFSELTESSVLTAENLDISVDEANAVSETGDNSCIDNTINEFKNVAITSDFQSTDQEITSQASEIPFSPKYNFANLIEIAKFEKAPNNGNHFYGCKWSPDGTCLLTNSADNILRIFDLPSEYHSNETLDTSNRAVLDLKPSLEMKEGGLISDYAWYPFMSSWNPPSCCFISTSSSSPVHLWDAYTGEIRASYQAYDLADELHSALSLCFSTCGGNIYCGFQNFVKVFDVSRPGRDCEVLNVKEISGQKGIISCICENPAVPELFAAGSYLKTIGLYTRNHEFVCLLTGQGNGLTNLKFSDDGWKLYSGGRMDNEIICWDIRNLGKVLFTMKRVVKTNQRIYFDLTKDNNYLISGGTDGQLLIYDINQEINKESELKCMHQLNLSKDCINGVSLHGSYPIIATSSGQRHSLDIANDDDDENMFYDNIDKKAENIVKIWWAGPTRCNGEHQDVNIDL